MNILKKFLCVILSIVVFASLVSCTANNNVYDNENYFTEEGSLTASPRFAYYNNGKEVSQLEDFDPQMAKEGPLDDGAFNVYFAVCNNSPYDRKLLEIQVKYIRTQPLDDVNATDFDEYVPDDKYDIVQPCEFTLDNEVYIASGQTIIIPCVFEKEFVLLEAKLDEIYTEATVIYEGCVVSGEEPKEESNSLTYSVKELKFTQSNGIEGAFSIRNNFASAKQIGDISFMLYTQDGQKITKTPVRMSVNSEIGANEILTLKYAVLPDNITQKIKEDKLFDSVIIDVTEE